MGDVVPMPRKRGPKSPATTLSLTAREAKLLLTAVEAFTFVLNGHELELAARGCNEDARLCRRDVEALDVLAAKLKVRP